ncbi:MAG: polysaccharide biosynthesis protein [Bacteroidales bacterium]|nr:polysaccharide biosynthesis protein [Bacteroidales bacterium]
MTPNINILRRITPRWVVFLIDIVICFASIVLAYYLRFNFHLSETERAFMPSGILAVTVIRAISFFIGKTYSGMVRFTGTHDIIRILIVIVCGSAALGVIDIITLGLIGKYIVPLSILIIDTFISTSTLIFSRLLIKILYLDYNSQQKISNNVLIYGMGNLAQTTKRAIERDRHSLYKVVGFIEHHKKVAGNKIDGIRIFHIKDLESVIDENNVSLLIISERSLSIARKNFVLDICLSRNVEVRTIPEVSTWVNGELSVNQIRKFKIEDLLERPEIHIDPDDMNRNIGDKVIMVTGAAGSIGSEIVRQLTRFSPKTIILFDCAESPLYDIELEIREEYKFTNIEIVIGDIRDRNLVNQVFDKYKPEIIYHAAAYKHVPMMENHPSEAIITNVMGTKILADTAVRHNAQKFVMISTDKAVNPTNVMGASKRIAEIYTQSLNNEANVSTQFITTRFGNVLGSNGSVIPRFRKQIENGGPITVTHPEITRYFMTIPEACQLVLIAGNMGTGGEIFIFDMGEPVKIAKLAEKMIMLSGLKVGSDIEIKYTGLRPGEKLYEELLASKENTIPTENNQIMVARVRVYNHSEVASPIEHLIEIAPERNDMEIVSEMKKIVPEFISNNSVFEELDKKIESPAQ